MEGSTAPRKKTGWLLKLILILLALVALTVVLDFIGVDVISNRESDTMIERPHAE